MPDDTIHLHRTSLVRQWHEATDKMGYRATCTCGWTGDNLHSPAFQPRERVFTVRAVADKTARDKALDDARHHFAKQLKT